ncbi:MAG: zinc-dependent metalloprotease [Planctomycetota bacterium]
MKAVLALTLITVTLTVAALTYAAPQAQLPGRPKSSSAKSDGLPPVAKVTKGFERVVSTADGAASLYTIWKRDRDAQLIAQLPHDFEKQRFLIVATVASGDSQAGVYSIWHSGVRRPAQYYYWKRYDKQLALVIPNLNVRSRGDDQSKAATARVNTDTVVLTTPIIAKGPKGEPVIDLDNVLVKQSSNFFGNFVRGANMKLATLDSAKAFPGNIEVTIGFPRISGQLASVHYSILVPPKDKTFKPRIADRRVGYYHVGYDDSSKNDGESQRIRYAYRWNVEKADPKLRLSPPKRPIVYYIEHTTPIRYRRWVREGILAWNKAFEKVGIVGAIEVYQQDAATGAHMDKDPEDSRYSFVRWTNANMGFAIGPVHVHPETGQIFEADIVMDEGFLSGWVRAHISTELASAAMAGMNAETVQWLNEHPGWDPRVRLAAPADRPGVIAYLRAVSQGTAAGMSVPPTAGPDVWSPMNLQACHDGCRTVCMPGYAEHVKHARIALDIGLLTGVAAESDDGDSESVLDGLPESFVGPLLKDVIMHETGHTMGLRHNWRGSALYSFAEINSKEMRGKKPHGSTVMDYTPTNIIVEDGELVQGDYTMIDIGPYDFWAIEWGYGDNPDETLKRAGQKEHAFIAEEGSSGPDPRAKVWEFGENSLDYADARIKYVHHVRQKLLEKGIKDGEPWAKVRRLYGSLLGAQLSACRTASNWIGGVYFHRHVKGDEAVTEDPVIPAPVDRQRRALQFLVENAFRDEAFDLRPEVLRKLGTQQWFDTNWRDEQDTPIHDRILGVQASVLTMILNPTKLRRVFDNELRAAEDEETLTIPEILQTLRKEIWSELDAGDSQLISSLRRGLQREHLDRMIALGTGLDMPGAAGETLASLARGELRWLRGRLSVPLTDDMDPYTRAHLDDANERVTRALEATYSRRR